MKNNTHPKTPAEFQELCDFTNWLWPRVWITLAVILAVCALIWNPYHLATAALLVLISRARWEVNDFKALEK